MAGSNGRIVKFVGNRPPSKTALTSTGTGPKCVYTTQTPLSCPSRDVYLVHYNTQSPLDSPKMCESDASACIGRLQAFALPPV